MLGRRVVAVALLAGVGACGQTEPDHPWIVLPEGSQHTIVESTGIGEGQVVIAMNPSVTPEEALALGERIRDQAPPGLMVNARLYNDEATARNWRTVAAEWTLEHLWVVVRVNPNSQTSEVRWVGPEDAERPAVSSGLEQNGDTATF